MSEALNRIRDEIQEYSTLIARLRMYPPHADLKEAYIRLSRVKDRYEHKESKLLEPVERVALAKVLEHDPLILDMLKLVRPIGEHVNTENEEEEEIRLIANSPVPITAETSARTMFDARVIVQLPDQLGEQERIEHLANLNDADKRILRALDLATRKLSL